MNRRHLLHTLAAGTLASQKNAVAASSDSHTIKPTGQIIDCNVWLGQHPCRRLPWNDTASIIAGLRERHVTQAWASTFDLILHRDLSSANARLAADCAGSGELLLPVGAINPTLPAWQGDLERCASEHSMKAIRVLPNYHGYQLDSPEFAELLTLAERHHLLVQVVAQLEDERTQHPLLRMVPVNLKLLPKTSAKVMVLNANSAHVLTALRGTSMVIDTGMIEGVGGVENLLKDWPKEQLVFGSHSPWFYWEANGLKLQESEFTPEQMQAVTHGNAERLLSSL
jgi:uncharacterized protein